MSRKEKNYKCDYCSKRFKREFDFLKHVRILHPTKTELTCALCNKVFTFSIDLRKHKWNDHENSELKSHIRKIHEESKHCTQCGKDFSTAQGLKRHIKCVHEGQRNFKCDSCGKSFTQSENLMKHIKTVHEGQKDHECEFCEKKFSTTSCLTSHIKIIHDH